MRFGDGGLAVVVRGAVLLIAWNRHFAGKAPLAVAALRAAQRSGARWKLHLEALRFEMTEFGHDNYVFGIGRGEAMENGRMVCAKVSETWDSWRRSYGCYASLQLPSEAAD